MAFRNLAEEDCGNSSSLLNFASHYAKDHGLKEEGINQPFPSSAIHQIPNANQFVQDFLEESACPQTFRMENLLREMRDINIYPPTAAPEVITELTNLNTERPNEHFGFRRQLEEKTECDMNDLWRTLQPPPIQNEEWAHRYAEHSTDNAQSDINKNRNTLTKFQSYVRAPIYRSPMYRAPTNFVTPYFVPPSFPAPVMPTHLYFSRLRYYNPLQRRYEKPPWKVSNPDAFLNKVEEELEVAGAWTDEVIKNDPLPQTITKEEVQLKNEKSVSFDINKLLEEQDYYKQLADGGDSLWKYNFKHTNPMKDLPNALEEGKKRLKKGDLPGAILCFEAAVQEEENNSEAWFLLGKAQAENEQDSLAICALRQCVKLDPTNGAALMALAVSYTNESEETQACCTLKKWIMENKKYKHLLNPPSHFDEQEKLLFEDWTTHSFFHSNDMAYNHLKNVYLEAARMNPEGEIDPDVQCGLGVLLSLKNEYEKAADCFEAALRVRPEDSGLWNRWGATLANGHRSGEAVTAYRRALELSPGFIRARYNLGISCINLGAHEQAAEHLLIALNQQAAGRKAYSMAPKTLTSNTIWSTLRLILTIMNKRHLMEFIEKRDLDKLNEEFGIA